MTKDVSTTHSEYEAAFADWALCEDAAAGESAVKAAREKYLPRPNAHDHTVRNIERYHSYVQRAVYYNATGRTLAGLLGLAFGEPPDIKLPPGIDFAEEDLSGTGLPLIQHAQATLAEILKSGRGGLLVDYPPLAASVSKAEQNRGAVRPTVSFYRASDVINWRTAQRGGKTVLSMVVLKECYEQPDGFGVSAEDQYRVLRLEDTYQVEIWRKVQGDDGRIHWVMAESYVPKQGTGQPWAEIPFTFVGAKNNDWSVDPAPLYDIATLNISHYRNSADYEDSVFVCGQPQYWIAGLDLEWRDHLEKSGLYIGARSPILLPQNGSMGIAQAQPNTLAKEAMSAKEAQMAALGARLIQEVTSNKTATQVNSEDAIAHSVLALCCTNVNAAYTKVLGWFANFANAAGDGSLRIPTDFSSYALDAQTLTALLQAVQANTMPLSDFWARLRAAGLIEATKDDESIQEEIEAQMPIATTTTPDPAGDPTGADPAAT
jgi:hypothetical protein